MAGLFFNELMVGQTFDHAIRRTVTETDNFWFSALTHSPAPLRLDEGYRPPETECGQHIVNSAFTLGTAIANLGGEVVRLPAHIFHRDTIRVRTKVIAPLDSRSHPNSGIVTVMHRNVHSPCVQPAERACATLHALRPAA